MIKTALRLTVLVGALSAPAVILDVDWDVVLSIVLGLAGIGYVVIDHRRVTKLDDWSQLFAERLATIEAQLASTNPHTLPERVATLEAIAGEAPDTTSILSRLAALEVERASADDLAGLRERVTVIETRIDFRKIDYTRRKNGKFASPDVAEESSIKEPPK